MNNGIHPSEQAILQSILDYLTITRIPHAHIRNTGIIIKENGKFRFGKPKIQQKGVSDIIACVCSVPLAIEVKAHNGEVSADQIEWLTRWTKEGGQAIVVNDLDILVEKINQIRETSETKNR